MKIPANLRLCALLLTLAALVLGGCGGGETNATELETEDTGKDAIPVEVAALAEGPIEAVLRSSTNLEAESAVLVLAEAARRVVEMRVEEGDVVRRGDLLVRLEDEAQRVGLARTRNQVERARQELARQQDLFRKELVSEKVFNDARHDLELLELALADSERELSYTEVRAPISGVLTQRLIKRGDAVSPGQELFEIIDFDSLVARVFVPERQLRRIAVGQNVRLVAESGSGASFDGVVDRIAPVVDPRSGTVKVTVRVPRAEGLRPGMFLQAELVTDIRADALLVPKRALMLDGATSFVYRIGDDDVAERVVIEPSLEAGDVVAVETGLAVGDRVVIAGQAGLKAGAQVRLVGGSDATL